MIRYDVRLSATVLRTLLMLALLSALVTTPQMAIGDNSVSIVVSPGSDRSYRHLTLPNGLRALLVSDPNTDKAAASLEVQVGSGDDPVERPGMAHFLEHMLFLGTQPFPTPGEYQQFLTAHGGSSNAYTAYEQTNYHFDVDADHLAGALDRFAAFFTAPLFTPDLVERERNAVHSEFTAKFKEDGRRYFDALKQAVNPAHPFSKFTVGNLDTLNGEDLAAEVKQFWLDRYSANLMTLAVVGTQTLDELETMVRDRFAQIENYRYTPQTVMEPLFEPTQLPMELQVQSLRDRRSLTLIFPIPEVNSLYRIKPTAYIGNLLGHEGEGSLFALLRQRGWVESLSAGLGIANRDSATFMVGIELTPEGDTHRDQVIDLVFQHIALIERNGINQWRHREQGQILNTEFKFLSDPPVLSHAISMAGALARYQAVDVIRGPYAWDAYDPPAIEQILDLMTPSNVIVSYSAPNVAGTTTSPWYDTPYRIDPIDDDRMGRWQQSRRQTSQFVSALPEANPFVATEFDLRAPPEQTLAAPDLLLDAGNHRHWHLQDTTFLKPRADIYLRLASDGATATLEQALAVKLIARLINEELNTQTYPARIAGLSFDVYRTLTGLTMVAKGYDQTVAELAYLMARAVGNPSVDEDAFDLIKADMLREFRDATLDAPYEQLFQHLPVGLIEGYWDIDSQIDVLEQMTPMKVAEGWRQLLSTSQIDILTHGNLSDVQGRVIATDLVSILPPSGIANRVDLPTIERDYAGETTQTVPINHQDSAWMAYWMAPDASAVSEAHFRVLGQVIKTPFYSQIRTDEQLGYIVFGSYMPLINQPGIVFAVQSPEASPPYIAERAQAFWSEFAQPPRPCR